MRDYRIGWHRGKFCVVWYDAGERLRRSLGTDDRREAERRLSRAIAAIEGDTTIKGLWDAYVREKRGRAVIATMEHTWKALGPHFGHHEPPAVTLDLCQSYAEKRRRTVRDGTIHTELGHLRTVLLWAVKRNLIDRAPHVERPVKPEPKDRHLTRKEARRLIEAAGMPHIRLAILLLLGTAARVGALLDLTWDRVDFDRGKVHLRDPEDGTARKGRATPPMNRTTRAALLTAREGALTDHVIEWGGKPVRSIKKGFAAACRKAGLDEVTPHVLRHTAAVWLAEGGTKMEEIAQYLGHSDLKTTRRVYARFSPDHLREAADLLDIDFSPVGGSLGPKSTSQMAAK